MATRFYSGGRTRASNNSLNLDLDPEALTQARVAALVRRIVELLDDGDAK